MKKKKCQWKRVVSILLSAILVFIPNVTAWAEGTESEIVTTEISKAMQVQEMEEDFGALWKYEINDFDQTVLLTRYIGEATDVVVPANIDIGGKEYSVIVDASGTSESYGYGGAFDNNKKIISVRFMHGSRIESNSMRYAFDDCDNLENVLDIPSGVTDMYYTFSRCGSLIEAPEIPSSVTDMEGTFTFCSSLPQSLKIPPSVTNMKCTFYGCSSLIEAPEIPSSVTNMRYTFYDCSSLIEAPEIPSSVTNMYSTFYGCSSLIEAPEIPSSVTNMYSTFYRCSSLIEAPEIPSVVINMESTFYGCSSLMQAPKILSSVTSMESTFSGCSSLTQAPEIPSSVMNMRCTFSDCSSLTQAPEIPSIVTDMRYTFSGCSSLTQAPEIPSSVTDMDSTFSGCSSLTQAPEIPSGVTNMEDTFGGCIGLTQAPEIPSGVTNMEDTFGGCIGLTQAPEIPSSVTDMWCTFSGCSSLTQAPEIPSSVTDMWGTFSGCSSLTQAPEIPSSVTDMGYTFSGCSSLTKAPEIPSSVTDMRHTFYDCNNLAGELTINMNTRNGNKDYYGCLYNAATSGNGLTVNYSSNCTKIDDIIATKGPGSKITKGRNVDSTPLPTETYTILFDTNGGSEAPAPITVTNGKPYGTLPTSTRENYQFKGWYTRRSGGVRIVSGSKASLNANQTLYAHWNDPYNVDFDLASEFEISVPEAVPLIGDSKVSMDLSFLPVQFEREGDAWRIGIGIDDMTEFSDGDWCNFKKFVETQNESVRKGINSLLSSKFGTSTMGMKDDVKVSAYGYAEGTCSNGNWTSAGGKLTLEISGSLKQEWQTIVVVVPVVIKLKGEAAAKATVSLGLDFAESSIYWEGKLDLTVPKITVSAGVGIAYICDVSVFGSADHHITVSIGTSKNLQMDEGYIKGAIGVSAKALFFSYSKELISGKLYYYPFVGFEKSSRFEVLEEDNYVIERTVTKGSSNWDALTKSYGFGSVTTLQEDVYGDAAPQLIKTKDVTMVVFTADMAERITGNHTAIVYSIYDKGADAWSAPTIIENDHTADFCPDVMTDGTDIYVAWMNTKDGSFTQESTMSEVGASCEIAVAKWNAGTQSFETDTLTNNAFVDMRPKLAICNGDVYAAWISNSDNDLLTQKGTNTINYAVKHNDMWSTYEAASYQHNAVVGLDIGEIENEIHLAYALDVDGDIATTDDVEIYTSALGQNAQALTNNGSYEQNIQYVSINGKSAFMWFADGKLLYSDDLSQTVELTSEEDMVASSDYSVVNGDAADMLITAHGEGDGRDIYAYVLANDTLTSPVKITGLEGYAAKANGYSEGEEYHLVFTRTNEAVLDGSVMGSTDICTAVIAKEHNMTLENVSFNPDNVAAGSTLPLTCTIKNNGLNDEADFLISASTMDGEIFKEEYTQSIQVGESAEAAISVPLPRDMPMGTEVTVQVMPQNAEDCDSTDNSYTITLGAPELKLTAEKTVTDTTTAITATITNTSSYDTMATLVIKDTDGDGTILKVYDDIAVAKIDSSVIEVSKEIVAEIADVGDTLYLEVSGQEDECFYSDNYTVLYIDGGKIKQLMLSQSDLNMQKDTSAVLTVDVQPSQLSDIGVYWTSSNKEVAEVDINGKVTAVSKGTAVITATANDGSEIEKSCNVTVGEDVIPIKVSGVTLKSTQDTIEAGGETTLTANVMPQTAANKNVTWSSSNTNVASVNGNGVVRAVSAGKAVITVTTMDGNKKASCQITVTARSIQKYSVNLNAMGGKVSPNVISAEAGKAYGTLQTPIRDGYIFLGWYTAKTGGSKVTSASKVSQCKDHTLYARWSGKTSKVFYNVNGGKISRKYKTVSCGSNYGTLAVPKRKKYEFKGWYTAKKGGKKITSGTQVKATKNHTIYAHWSKVTVKKISEINVKNSKSKKLTISIGKVKGVSGYQIVYGMNSAITKGKKTLYISSKKAVIKNLKKGKTYYIKARPYKKDSTGKKIYGLYTSVKKVKIKK